MVLREDHPTSDSWRIPSSATMPSNKVMVNFDAAGDEHRQRRLRCATSCRAYNDMAEDAPPEERVRKWCA
jgi:hypothetical protein